MRKTTTAIQTVKIDYTIVLGSNFELQSNTLIFTSKKIITKLEHDVPGVALGWRKLTQTILLRHTEILNSLKKFKIKVRRPSSKENI